MKKMLIVEDDDLTQKVMRRIFKHDYEMDFCESGNEYYEKYSNTEYEIIIMDISINGNKNGLELIKEIKAVSSYSGAPIICLTANAQIEMQQLATESCADIVITKPVSINLLKKEVESLVKLKQLV